MRLATKARARLEMAMALTVIAVLVAGCGTTSVGSKDPLAGIYFGSGSGAALEQVQALAKRFGVLHPGVEFKLDDAGADAAVALVGQQIDFGYMSRDMTAEELNRFVTTPLTGAGTAIAVNAANPVTGLAKEQVRDIFAGRITDWGAVGGQPGHPIQVIVREPGSTTRVTFETYFFGGTKLAYPTTSINVVESKEAYAQIRAFKDSIAMVTLQTSTQNDPTMHLLSLDGVAATTAKIANGTYPIRRPVHLFVSADSVKVTPAVRAFIEFIKSPEGAKILSAF